MAFSISAQAVFRSFLSMSLMIPVIIRKQSLKKYHEWSEFS